MLLLAHRDRKVLVRVLPNDGYKMEVEIKKDTSIKEVIKTLQELGFSYGANHISMSDVEVIKQLFDSFINLSKDYGEIILSNDGLYESWLKFGFDLINIQRPVNEKSINSNEINLNPNSNHADDLITTLDDDKQKIAHKQDSTLGENISDKCDYCDIFKNLNSYVCPQCGKPLNIASSEN